jgi:hypothetical protein
LKNERLENNSSIYCKKHLMRYKANFPQISENFIKYTMKTKIQNETSLHMYRNLVFSRNQQPNLNTISFSDEGVIPIKPALSRHAVVAGLDKLYRYDHKEKNKKNTVILSYWLIMLS